MPFTTPATAIPLAIVQAQHRNILRDNDQYFVGLIPAPTAANQVPVLVSASSGTQRLLTQLSFEPGALSTSHLGATIVTNAKIGSGVIGTQHLTNVAMLIPAGVILRWNSVTIPTGWVRETPANGRMPVTAGTVFGVSWAEETNYGSSWGHLHPLGTITTAAASDTVPNLRELTPGASRADEIHTHTYTGNTESAAWIIPSRASVLIRKT